MVLLRNITGHVSLYTFIFFGQRSKKPVFLLLQLIGGRICLTLEDKSVLKAEDELTLQRDNYQFDSRAVF